MVSAVAALMAAMMVVISAPAMARDFDFNRNHHDNDDVNRVVFFGDRFNDHDRFNDRDRFDSDLNQESESGDVENNFRVSNTGDYASQCTPAIQFGNTGNFNNGSSFVQFGSDNNNDDDFNHFNDRRDHFGFFDDNFNRGLDDFEPGGIDVSFAPEQNTDCSNTIEQSSAASSNPWTSWWGW